jgi:hypothetical protein
VRIKLALATRVPQRRIRGSAPTRLLELDVCQPQLFLLDPKSISATERFFSCNNSMVKSYYAVLQGCDSQTSSPIRTFWTQFFKIL